MPKTFDESLIDTAVIPMSMIDPEDMEDTTSEEFRSLRRIQQGCHNELTNRKDFPFNRMAKTVMTRSGLNSYAMVEGKIKSIVIQRESEELKYVENFLDLGKDNGGVPKYYTLTDNPERIKVFPTPDNTYNMEIEYFNTKNIIPVGGGSSYTITVGSTLKMPDRFQHLYFDALEYYVLYEYMRKTSNPRFEPTYKIFLDKWNTFLDGTKTSDSETYFSI